jgi:predicted transposase YdaD
MRHIFSNQPIVELEALLKLIVQIEDRKTALEILEVILRYYVQGTQRIDEPTAKIMLQALPVGDKTMQTWIDNYINQGVEQGLQQGLQQGRQEGRQEGLQEGLQKSLLLQIEEKFGKPPKTIQQKIAESNPDTLLRWSRRILVAKNLDALFD